MFGMRTLMDLLAGNMEEEERTLKQLLRPKVLADGMLQAHPAIPGADPIEFSEAEFVELAEAYGFECRKHDGKNHT